VNQSIEERMQSIEQQLSELRKELEESLGRYKDKKWLGHPAAHSENDRIDVNITTECKPWIKLCMEKK
jgi:hypothetical protein